MYIRSADHTISALKQILSLSLSLSRSRSPFPLPLPLPLSDFRAEIKSARELLVSASLTKSENQEVVCDALESIR